MLNSTAGDADATCRRLLAKRAFKCSMPQSQDPPRTEVVFALTVDLWVCIVSKLLPHERAALCHTCSTSRAAVFEHAALARDGAARFAKEQADAWAKAAVLGGSIFVTGGAGTGKTHVTRQIVEAALERDEFDAKVEAEAARAWAELQQRQKAEAFSAVERLKLQVDEDSRSEFHDAERFLKEVDNESPCDTYEERQPSIAVVTPTGAAARVASTSNLRAFTVHRLFNIRAVKREPGSEPVVVDPGHENDARVDDESDAHMDEADTADDSEEDTDPGCLPTCVLDKYTRGVLRALRTLVIDEVSMLDSDMLETIDCALRHATGCSSPFGGVQVVAVGDFYQLAPVTKGSDRIKWAFTSPLWRALTPVSLTEVHRQKNARFASFLNRVRDGSATQADVNWFTYRAVGAGTAPLTIMPFNKRCNDVNDRALDRVTGSVVTLEPHCFCQVMFPGGPVRIPDQQLPRTPIYSKKATAKTVGVKVGGRVRVTRNVYEGAHAAVCPSHRPLSCYQTAAARSHRDRLSPQARIHIARSWPPTGSEARSSVWTTLWSWSTSTRSLLETLQSA